MLLCADSIAPVTFGNVFRSLSGFLMLCLPLQDSGYLFNIPFPRSEEGPCLKKSSAVSLGLVAFGLAYFNFHNSILEPVFDFMKTLPFVHSCPQVTE